MNAIIYITLFIMGTLFGSFYTLAVYRIPRRIDIIKTHSFCPKCNHKLGFFELIPVLSYLALGGKCKVCHQKIKPRYLILEVLSGMTFVLIGMALKINIYSINMQTLISLAFIILYLVAVFIIAGIDKEYRKIEKSVLFYAIIISVIHIIYLCVIDMTSIYRYMMYLSAILILLMVDTLALRKTAKNNYVLQNLMFLLIMAIFTGEIAAICTVILTLIMVALRIIFYKIKNNHSNLKKSAQISDTLQLGFYMGLANVISFITVLFLIQVI